MKHLKLLTGAGIMLMLSFIAISAVQQPEAEIVVEAWSPQELHDLGWESHPSTGLKVVGMEELVYLFVKESSGEEITTVAWTIASQPTGSTATLDSTDTQRTTFHPDTTGQFEIQADITTASGAATATVTITSTTYVGVGIWTELADDPTQSDCYTCHPNKVMEWVQTEHPTLFKDGIDGVASSHYNESCIECHTVGFFEGANNGGFWDVQQEVGWEFPETLEEGNWDSLVTNFPELAKLGSIQCENCHGPAQQHVGPPLDVMNAPEVSLEEGVCGRCHEEQPYHRKNQQWKLSGHAAGGVAFAAARESCAPCHSGRGFVNQVDSDVPFEEGIGFPFISCAVCHDPHDATLDHQLRNLDNVTLMNGESFTFGGFGKLCMSCHLSRRDAEVYVQEYHDHFGPHHSNQADMLAGTNAIHFGMPVPSTNHKGVLSDACVTCHMADTPGTGQPGRDRIGEHTFAMHWDGGTPEDPSDDVDLVAACTDCHGPITSFADIKAKEDYDGDGSIEGAQEEVHGMLEEVGMLLPPLGDPEVNVIAEDYDPTLPGLTPEEVAERQLFLKAAYNYFFVEEDGSHGIHNLQYAANLLKVTHQALTTGSLGAGIIQAITDVPNDQGKQVRIVWTRFGGDGVGDNPTVEYAIWRKVDDATNGAAKVSAAYNSIDITAENIKALDLGTKVQMDEELWDFAGSVPAAGLETYSAIAPTLFDSTIVDGMHWTTFMISGHTATPGVYTMSAPDSGYSIDNLAPTAPGNLVAEETTAGVAVAWDDPVDADFDYFALYRSTTEGFDPSTTEPLAELTETSYTDPDVTVGTTYYYRLSAFDFSGNESAFSEEFSIVVTSVEDVPTEMIPQDYALEQNYPNPFNPSTTIKFSLKEAGHVNMTIYNAIGEKVMEVIDGQMNAGHHDVIIRSDGLTSGLYFYRIQVNGYSSVKKMILMK